METINYLTSIISLLQKTPQAQEIIDTQGLGQELTFGQIGIKDAKAFLKLYDVLGSAYNDHPETVPALSEYRNREYLLNN